jgi:DNA-binding response OmpR family regulator
MNILIAEDEKHLATGLQFNLEAEGYTVDIAGNGRVALDMLGGKNYNAVVLDVMMPEVNGFEVAAEMRESGDYTPILMLTALGKPEDVLKGFESGADDYLPKPFDLSIFLARLNGLLRRRQWLEQEKAKEPETKQVILINGRTIDLENLELRTESETIRLTLMEANLLKYLFENEGRAISRKAILEEVWDLHYDTDTRAIDNFIVRLRRYLEDEPNSPKILQTVRGVGYKFVLPK